MKSFPGPADAAAKKRARWSADELERARACRTLGHSVHVRPVCESTQAEAHALAGQGAPHGTLVVAHTQSAGRGRRGRAWLSAEGGLYFSLVLRPELPVERLPRLPLLAAAGLAEGILALGAEAFVKWPNDVLLPAASEGALGPFRKVAGILVEPALLGGRIEAVVLGIGVNVRPPKGGFGETLSDRAGSLLDAGVEAGPDEVLLAVLDPLERWLHAPADDEVFAACRARLCERSATLGRRVVLPEEGLFGLAESIDPEGALWLRTDDGGLHRVIAGDVLPAR